MLLLAACGADEPRGTADEVPVTMGGAIAPAPGVYPFQGTWAADLAACGSDPMAGQGAPTVITTQSVLHQGQRCAIESVTQADAEPGMTAALYAIALDCRDADDPPFAVTVDGDALTVLDGAARTVLQRCEPSARGE